MSATAQSPKRRWYQFSLRTLLIVMTLFTMGVGWVQYRRQRAQDNWQRWEEGDEAAMREVDQDLLKIEELGGSVDAYYQYDERTWLELLFDDPGAPNGKIGIVVGGEPEFTDTGLEHLREFTELTVLYLSETAITDAGLENIEGLTNLESLHLSETQVTDAGLEHLKGLANLQNLDLANTKVTDASIEHLRGLTHLQNLDLRGTKVTEAGVKQFDQALPNCRIWYGSRQFILE